MVNMYYQISPRKRTLYIPGRKNRAMIIPVKQQPPADARLKQFCVELDPGWADMADIFIGKDEDRLSPKCALRSAKRISDILSILYRIFAPTEENVDSDVDLQGDSVKFVPLRWYKDNNGRDVTILSALWFNNQVVVANIIMAPLGQEGVVFVDMAYTVTKRGLKLTLVMEMEVNKEKAIKDIMGSFLKISMLDDQTENTDLEDSDSSVSPSETSAVLSQQVPTVLTPEKTHAESPRDSFVQYIMQVGSI
ncbi:Hypp2085 [Branchiostoma lanceolatum]|uniref:Hypp2085 protein n=1 Tax=Branchiostoma lanceolatum TaxID=7740 RepID=A0A8K0ERZ7_BRALA|nr:Hypp2085 [Branchiostoma lanceolatum]